MLLYCLIAVVVVVVGDDFDDDVDVEVVIHFLIDLVLIPTVALNLIAI